MAENGNGLDSFLSPDEPNTPAKPNTQQSSANVNLEDEFAKLLNDFISQDDEDEIISSSPQPQQVPSQQEKSSLDALVSSAPQNTQNSPQQQPTGGLDDLTMTSNNVTGGLDSLVSTTETGSSQDNLETSNNSGGLDSFMSAPVENQTGGLDGFVSAPVSNSSGGLDGFVNTPQTTSSPSGELDSLISESVTPETEDTNSLKAEEQELARAVSNFKDGVTAMASNKNLKMPQTDYEESMLIPNYKPSVGKKIAQYLLACWDVINKYDPENMKRLSPDAGDEEFLSFAESLNDTYMQLAIISYVEILINIEICEVSYEQKKELLLKNKIKRELYEEYMELQERKNMFIQKLKEKNFPIDADKLINNYFRAAQKDADGAFDALTKNPAMFSRIEVEKLKPKFFGLIKVTPEDGIKVNQKIGKFIKNLKV